MRVLHVQRVAGIGGSERHLLTLLPALAAQGVEVRMAVAALGEADRFVQALEDRGVGTVCRPAGADLGPALAAQVAREVRRFRPDVVHTHLIHADLYGQVAAALCRVPGVSSVHSRHAFYRRHPGRAAAVLAARLARRTIAISHAVEAFLVDGGVVRPGRVRVVHYGVDLGGWDAGDASRVAAREAFGVGERALVVGVASRLVAGKGHDLLIEAVASAHRSDARLRLLVAGEGPLRPALERQAGATLPSGVARFLGFVGDVPAFMAACDVVVFPSQVGEGFGLAALEAMAAGRAVVATALGPLPELVDHGRTGLLVDPHSPQAMAAALLALAVDDDLRARMGAAARARAAAEFSAATMAARTRAVYEEVASGGPGAADGFSGS